MAIQRVKEYMKQFGLEERIQIFSQSSATVEMAALAVGCEAARIAKTLSFFVEETVILIVAAGDARIDNKKYKDRFGCKAKMLSREIVEERIGHDVGGVCPFGINPGVKVYLDESLRRFDTVFPAAGSSNSTIALSLAELEETSRCEAWVDVCKDWISPHTQG